MKFLIDTHCWLWLLTEPKRFRIDLVHTLRNPSTQRFLSAASVWEIAVKHSIGKLPLPEPPSTYIPERMRLSKVEGLAITPAHALTAAALPPHHRDPFDRILVAQAQVEGLVLLTADKILKHYDVEQIGPR